LLLKSDTDLELDVNITIKDLPYNEEHEKQKQAYENEIRNASIQQQNFQQQNFQQQNNVPQNNVPQNIIQTGDKVNVPEYKEDTIKDQYPTSVPPAIPGKKKWGGIKFILTIIVLVAGGALLWYFFIKKKKLANKSLIESKTNEANLINYITSMKQQQILPSTQLPSTQLSSTQLPSTQLPSTQLPSFNTTQIPTTSNLPTKNIESIINENLLSKINNLPI